MVTQSDANRTCQAPVALTACYDPFSHPNQSEAVYSAARRVGSLIMSSRMLRTPSRRSAQGACQKL